MRVTGTHLIDMVSAAGQKAEQQVADATQVASSGLRVATPATDPAAWAIARRAEDRKSISAGRGDAIAGARDRMQATDGALASIGDLVEQARSIAVQASNGTLDAAARANLATEVTSYLAAAVAAGNTRTSDGEYVLAGARSQTAPFDAAGNYSGDAQVRSIESGEGRLQPIGVPGSALTAAQGIDVLPALGALAAALSSNNVSAIRTSIDTFAGATDQVSRARADAGAALKSLDDADGARTQLELTLTGVVSRAVEADPVAAASQLTKASAALDTAQAVASRVFALVQQRSA